MKIIGKKILEKLKYKNKGNLLLTKSIDNLVAKIESRHWKSKEEVKRDRPDADQVHPDGFYFFNIEIHRTLILVLLGDAGSATVVWAGSHSEYETKFKNNKAVIRKWLSDKDWI